MEQEETLLEQFADIIQLGQLEYEFDLPGREETHRVRVGTLWNDDIIKIKERAGKKITFGDIETRREIEINETLVECILSIDGIDFHDSYNMMLNDEKKSQLREILRRASPHLVTCIYEKYIETTKRAYQEIDRRIDEVKKSSGPSQQETELPELK